MERLAGEGREPEDLNGDSPGRALDALYDYGVTESVYLVAAQALATYNIEHRFVHLDTTSFSLHGKYEKKEEPDPGVAGVTKGYSKDGQPDLNQVVASMMYACKSTIPVWIEVLSGNGMDDFPWRF